MIDCKNFDELDNDDIDHISHYSLHLYELVPLEDDQDYLIFKNQLRHLIEILEKENGKN